MVLDSVYGNRNFDPAFAIRETDRIAPEDDLEEALQARKKEGAGRAREKRRILHFHAVALDAERWELVRYSLWKSSR